MNSYEQQLRENVLLFLKHIHNKIYLYSVRCVETFPQNWSILLVNIKAKM